MPPPKASKPAADQETEWAAQGTKGPGSQPSSYKHFPRASGQTPWPSHSKGIEGLWDGFWQRPWERQQGVGAMGLECPCTPTPPPLPMDQSQEALQSGGSYCLSAGPELCSIQALFLAPGGRGKESKERSCCSRRNLGLEMIPGPAGPEKAVTVGSKDPELKRSWQGAGVRGSQRRVQMGQPWPFAHTC